MKPKGSMISAVPVCPLTMATAAAGTCGQFRKLCQGRQGSLGELTGGQKAGSLPSTSEAGKFIQSPTSGMSWAHGGRVQKLLDRPTANVGRHKLGALF